MSLWKRFFPDYRLASIFELEPGWLKEHGFSGLILDIDNTLVSPNAPADKRAMDFIARMRQAGMGVLVLSNNSPERAKSFAAMLGCPYLAKAGKPRPHGFWQAAEILGTDQNNTLVVGDQLLTDVYGAHRAGLKCLLVEALDPAHEQPFVRVKRLLEKPIRKAYERNQAKSGGD